MKKLRALLPLVLILALAVIHTAAAQDTSPLALRLSRNIGYSSGRGDIQGSFTLKASGPADLARVVFYLDGETLGEAAQAPFNLRFSTDAYPLGLHTFNAMGYTAGGAELSSNPIEARFVTAEEGWKAGGRIALPLLAIVGAAFLLSFIPVMMSRGKQASLPPGTARNYGMLGGAICPRCGRPFPQRFLAINLGPGLKFDRCPHCGKWAVMRNRKLDDLRAAEAAELEQARVAGTVPVPSAEEKLRKDLEESRYQDL